jgi:thymidylate kinase
MIIEFFGPPGVGKTTLVHALATRLQRSGRSVKRVLSFRPIEDPVEPLKEPARHQTVAVARRLVRPMIEIFAGVGHPSGKLRAADTATKLTEMFPPRNILWSLRLHLYLRRLSRSWDEARRADEVVLFDQGFVQAVCSLVVLTSAAEPELVAHALDVIPEPDLLVRLDASPEILQRRLSERLQKQARIERMLELDLVTSLGSAQVIGQLHQLLEKRGQPVTSVESTDRQALRKAVDRLEEMVSAFEREIAAPPGMERAR